MENLTVPQSTPFCSVRIIFVTFLESVSKVLPVILLFLLGMLLNRRQFMRPATMADLKNLVIKITLPAALFLAFSRVSLEPRHLIIVGVMFGACVLAHAARTAHSPDRAGAITLFPNVADRL